MKNKNEDFIINKLKEYIELFPTAKVRYENDTLAKVHVIEINPKELYTNPDSIEWEFDFCDKFSFSSPSENIYFITSDALVGIENVTFEIAGINYKN